GDPDPAGDPARHGAGRGPDGAGQRGPGLFRRRAAAPVRAVEEGGALVSGTGCARGDLLRLPVPAGPAGPSLPHTAPAPRLLPVAPGVVRIGGRGGQPALALGDPARVAGRLVWALRGHEFLGLVRVLDLLWRRRSISPLVGFKASWNRNLRSRQRTPVARFGRIDRSIGEPPCARRCRRTNGTSLGVSPFCERVCVCGGRVFRGRYPSMIIYW